MIVSESDVKCLNCGKMRMKWTVESTVDKDHFYMSEDLVVYNKSDKSIPINNCRILFTCLGCDANLYYNFHENKVLDKFVFEVHSGY